jgi:phosphoglycolate phosphatase
VGHVTHVLFDLDGTLIDSSRSILLGFDAALREHGLAPRVALDSRLIGPPLPEALRILSGEDDPQRLAALAKSFTDYYDTEGFKASDAYPGAGAMLDALRSAGLVLHIATNKRFLPTQRILQWLGWAGHFGEVYAIDKHPGARFADKASMIAYLMASLGLQSAHGVYVGDRDDDRAAATANGLPFVLAAWGYGDYADLSRYPVLARAPGQLLALLLGLAPGE